MAYDNTSQNPFGTVGFLGLQDFNNTGAADARDFGLVNPFQAAHGTGGSAINALVGAGNTRPNIPGQNLMQVGGFQQGDFVDPNLVTYDPQYGFVTPRSNLQDNADFVKADKQASYTSAALNMLPFVAGGIGGLMNPSAGIGSAIGEGSGSAYAGAGGSTLYGTGAGAAGIAGAAGAGDFLTNASQTALSGPDQALQSMAEGAPGGGTDVATGLQTTEGAAKIGTGGFTASGFGSGVTNSISSALQPFVSNASLLSGMTATGNSVVDGLIANLSNPNYLATYFLQNAGITIGIDAVTHQPITLKGALEGGMLGTLGGAVGSAINPTLTNLAAQGVGPGAIASAIGGAASGAIGSGIVGGNMAVGAGIGGALGAYNSLTGGTSTSTPAAPNISTIQNPDTLATSSYDPYTNYPGDANLPGTLTQPGISDSSLNAFGPGTSPVPSYPTDINATSNIIPFGDGSGLALNLSTGQVVSEFTGQPPVSSTNPLGAANDGLQPNVGVNAPGATPNPSPLTGPIQINGGTPAPTGDPLNPYVPPIDSTTTPPVNPTTTPLVNPTTTPTTTPVSNAAGGATIGATTLSNAAGANTLTGGTNAYSPSVTVNGSDNAGLITALGALAGAVGGSKPAGTTTTVQDLPDWLKLYVINNLNQAQTYLNNNPQDNSLLGPATQYQQDVISGKYLNSNPYLDTVYQRAADPVLASLAGQFSKAGRYGSGAMAATEGKTLADLSANIYGTNYANERQIQNTAGNNAPAFTQTAASVPYSAFNAFGNLTKQNVSETTTPYFTNPVGGALSGALAGYGLSNAFGG